MPRRRTLSAISKRISLAASASDRLAVLVLDHALERFAHLLELLGHRLELLTQRRGYGERGHVRCGGNLRAGLVEVHRGGEASLLAADGREEVAGLVVDRLAFFPTLRRLRGERDDATGVSALLELVGGAQAAGRHRIANELRYQAGASARVAVREAALVED